MYSHEKSRTIVSVSMVTIAILLATEDVTEAEPKPELSCVNLVWSCNSSPLYCKDMMSPLVVWTAGITGISLEITTIFLDEGKGADVGTMFNACLH